MTRIVNLLQRFAYAFVPQLVRSKIWADHAPPSRVFSTSWMDGLRGITALLTFNFHFLFAFNDMTSLAYGTDENHTAWPALPFIRLLFTGKLTTIFFTVAGYVCAARAMQLMRQNDSASRDKLLQTLGTSAFRKIPRLYLPVIVYTLMIVVAVYLGMFETLRKYQEDMGEYFPGDWAEPQVERFPTLMGQLKIWLQEMNEMTNFLNISRVYPSLDRHLWTIHKETQASMLLLVSLLATARVHAYTRLSLLVVLAFCYMWWDMVEATSTFFGAAIAQYNVLREPREEPPLSEKTDPQLPFTISTAPPSFTSYYRLEFMSRRNMQLWKFFVHFLWLSAFISSLYMLSWPFRAIDTYAPGFEFLRQLIPSFWVHKELFYSIFGSATLIACLSRADPCSMYRRALTSDVAMYLGRIMFALYLVHGSILHTYGYLVPIWFWDSMGGRDTTVGYVSGLLFGWAVSLLASLWAADVFQREVILRTVRLVKWIEDMCLVKLE